MRNFVKDGMAMAIEATYFVGDVQYGLIEHWVSTGLFQYSFTFECPISSWQDADVFYTAMQMFRW